jgi:hypothetical protein
MIRDESGNEGGQMTLHGTNSTASKQHDQDSVVQHAVNSCFCACNKACIVLKGC